MSSVNTQPSAEPYADQQRTSRELITPHELIRKRSYTVFENARAQARLRKQYDSDATRSIMTEECKRRIGFVPCKEQLDLAECMLLGVDAVTIAGAGWGKTLPFVLPLFVPASNGKLVIIISPLNALENDQVRDCIPCLVDACSKFVMSGRTVHEDGTHSRCSQRSDPFIRATKGM